MRQKLVVGNWKMHGSKASNQSLLSVIADGAGGAGAALAVCVPFPYLQQAQDVLQGSKVALGAQDMSAHAQGAYTGEVAGSMLKDFGCRYVLVGHSERRSLHGEMDDLVAAKAVMAVLLGLQPIVCIGETLAERDAGQMEAVVTRQLDSLIKACGAERLASMVLAYEPVWAIGTGRTATPAQAQEAHALLRGRLADADAALAADMQLLYGGSVKPANALELFAQPDIDGGLVGGASLVAEEFLAIGRAVASFGN